MHGYECLCDLVASRAEHAKRMIELDSDLKHCEAALTGPSAMGARLIRNLSRRAAGDYTMNEFVVGWRKPLKRSTDDGTQNKDNGRDSTPTGGQDGRQGKLADAAQDEDCG